MDVSQMAATTMGRRAAAVSGFGARELELCFINILTIVNPNPKISYIYIYIYIYITYHLINLFIIYIRDLLQSPSLNLGALVLNKSLVYRVKS